MVEKLRISRSYLPDAIVFLFPAGVIVRAFSELLSTALAVLVFVALPLTVRADEQLQSHTAADPRASQEIFYHQEFKALAAGETPEARDRRVLAYGLNPNQLDREDCALYLADRPDPGLFASLRARGVVCNEALWVPPVGRHPHGFILAVVPYDALRSSAAKPGFLDARIVRIASTETSCKPQNNVSIEVVNARPVHDGVGGAAVDGTGVAIAVSDSSVDLTHPDFPTAVEVYDMTDGTDPGTWGTDVSTTASDHGTHVSATVLGRGTASVGNTGNGGGAYTGSAPGADLYFYKIGNDTTSNASGTDMIESIDRAAAVGCDVFTMSYGGYSTWNDGSDAVCQAVDAAVAGGMTCFFSAGNNADLGGHYSDSVAPGVTSSSFDLIVDNTGVPFSSSAPVWLRLIWIDDDETDLQVSLSCSNLSGSESLVLSSAQTSVRDTEGSLYILTPDVAANSQNTYNLTLTNGAGSGDTPLVHCYIVGGRAGFVTPDPAYTVGFPALADSAIAVAAWVHREDWVDHVGDGWTFGFTNNTRAPFSSIGPRIDGVQKPDLAAPGATTISAKDSSAAVSFADFETIDSDGANVDGSGPAEYVIKNGTSMACPLAAGTAALLLEADPTMTPAEIYTALTSTASMALTPDAEGGYGLVNVFAALHSDAPTPDECADAVTAVEGFNYFNSTPATNSADAFTDVGFCEGTDLGGCHRDVWFSFVAPAFGDLTVSTCNQVNFDTDLVMYTGTCGSLTQVACNGDGTGCPDFTSSFQFTVTGATEYFIRLGGWDAAQHGVGVLELVFVADTDCNGNMISDVIDISMGTSLDCNLDDIPDECQSLGPSILTGPQSDSSCLGGSPVLSVNAMGDGILSYQWRLDGSDVAGATSSSLVLNSVQASEFGSYTVLVTDDCGSQESAPATLSMIASAVITGDPASVAVCDGGSTVLSITASGPGLFYQWRLNGAALGGEVAATLALTGVSAAQAGSYDCVVSNVCGSVTSAAAVVSLLPGVQFSAGPMAQAACLGEAVVLSVTATGSGTVTYQWRKDASDLSGELSDTLSIPSYAVTDAGVYSCVVSDDCGPVESGTAVLSTRDAVQITAQPSSSDLCEGTNANFMVSATGTAPLTYQWTLDGLPVVGATSSTLSLSSVIASDSGDYRCEVTDGCTNVELSAVATLSVLSATMIDTPPTATTLCQEDPLSLSVGASGAGVLSYQWYKDSVVLAGQTSATLTIDPALVADSGDYHVEVTGTCGTAIGVAVAVLVENCDAPFVRADVNADGMLDVSDPIALIDQLFLAGSIPCDDAADVNDDGTVDVSDVSALLSFVFAMGPSPAAPYPLCGGDAAGDPLGCDTFAACP